MIVLPKRLIAFWVAVTAVSVLAVVRGSSTDGPGVVYTTLGVLGIASILLFVIGWIRQSRRRR